MFPRLKLSTPLQPFDVTLQWWVPGLHLAREDCGPKFTGKHSCGLATGFRVQGSLRVQGFGLSQSLGNNESASSSQLCYVERVSYLSSAHWRWAERALIAD